MSIPRTLLQPPTLDKYRAPPTPQVLRLELELAIIALSCVSESDEICAHARRACERVLAELHGPNNLLVLARASAVAALAGHVVAASSGGALQVWLEQ